MNMKKLTLVFLLITGISIVLINIGCSKDIRKNTAIVSIDLGLDENEESKNITGKAPAPSGITQITLIVSAADMQTITRDIPLDTGALTLEVPAGPGRLFQVTAYHPNGNLGGSATADLVAGESVNLQITMSIQYTNLSINTVFPAGTPTVNTTGTYTVYIRSGGTTIFTSTFTPGTPFSTLTGDNLDIEVIENNISVDFIGILTGQTLVADSPVLEVNMALYTTKLLVPDGYNNRLVQIDDITGSGWTVFDYTNMAAVDASWTNDYEFLPWFVDYDAMGRIYIANNYSDTPGDVIIRMDNINGGNIISFASNSGIGYSAIAIDRVNNIVYKAENSTPSLSMCGLDGSGDTPLNFNNVIVLGINALAIGNSGTVYIVYYNDSYDDYLGIYDPSSGNITASYYISMGSPFDILYKSPYVYIAVFSGGDDNLIVRLNSDLTNPAGYGIAYGGTEGTGIFHGPQRFIGRDNDLFTIWDADCSYSYLISTVDMSWTGWTVYGTAGNGVGEFALTFNGCK